MIKILFRLLIFHYFFSTKSSNSLLLLKKRNSLSAFTLLCARVCPLTALSVNFLCKPLATPGNNHPYAAKSMNFSFFPINHPIMVYLHSLLPVLLIISFHFHFLSSHQNTSSSLVLPHSSFHINLHLQPVTIMSPNLAKPTMARTKTIHACPYDDSTLCPNPRSHPPSLNTSEVSTPSLKADENLEPYSLSPPKSITTSTPFNSFKWTYKPWKTK